MPRRLLWDLRLFCFLRVKELSPHSGPSGEQPTQMETEEMEASSNGALITSDVRDKVDGVRQDRKVAC